MALRYPELDLDRQLCFPLYAAARAVVRAYGPLLDAVGLTYPQYLAMLALWGSPTEPMTVGELGERLRLDTGTLTPLLKRLENAGHLSRRRDPDDERRVLLQVTDQGWALRDEVAHVPGELLRSMRLNPDDIPELRRLLDHVLNPPEPGDEPSAPSHEAETLVPPR
ncbi:MAG TPA: MarR family transcriptional regulator [Acidimicrobiales bacterium]|jgi:MarR family transcriptional regulator, organic hydroperoxide resistance regulator|nr:MarR family transcriptional regulator [Acidimicrobiales bacterium]